MTMIAIGITDNTGFIVSPVGRLTAPFFLADKPRQEAGPEKNRRGDFD